MFDWVAEADADGRGGKNVNALLLLLLDKGGGGGGVARALPIMVELSYTNTLGNFTRDSKNPISSGGVTNYKSFCVLYGELYRRREVVS